MSLPLSNIFFSFSSLLFQFVFLPVLKFALNFSFVKSPLYSMCVYPPYVSAYVLHSLCLSSVFCLPVCLVNIFSAAAQALLSTELKSKCPVAKKAQHHPNNKLTQDQRYFNIPPQ